MCPEQEGNHPVLKQPQARFLLSKRSLETEALACQTSGNKTPQMQPQTEDCKGSGEFPLNTAMATLHRQVGESSRSLQWQWCCHRPTLSSRPS